MSKAITNDPERDPALGHEFPKGATAGPLAEQQNELDAAIGLAQRGRVNLTPAKAIDMAGRLYAQGRFAQAERVSRQIVAARPALADAHNILGASLEAL